MYPNLIQVATVNQKWGEIDLFKKTLMYLWCLIVNPATNTSCIYASAYIFLKNEELQYIELHL